MSRRIRTVAAWMFVGHAVRCHAQFHVERVLEIPSVRVMQITPAHDVEGDQSDRQVVKYCLHRLLTPSPVVVARIHYLKLCGKTPLLASATCVIRTIARVFPHDWWFGRFLSPRLLSNAVWACWNGKCRSLGAAFFAAFQLRARSWLPYPSLCSGSLSFSLRRSGIIKSLTETTAAHWMPGRWRVWR